MAPPKKPTIKKTNIPGYYLETVGKNFTLRTEKRIAPNITQEALKKIISENPFPDKFGAFDGYIAKYEREAKKTLEDAGLPTEPDRFYTIPGGKLLPIPTIQERATGIYTRAGGLLELVTSRGKRERVDQEWYAAAILNSILNIRLAMRRGDGESNLIATCSAELGILMTEKEVHKRFKKYFDSQENKGKKRGEQISAEKQKEHDSWKEVARDVRERKSGASKTTVAGIVKTRLKSSASVRTIRNVI